jgi:hypothetical protein
MTSLSTHRGVAPHDPAPHDPAPRVRDDAVVSVPARVVESCGRASIDAESIEWADMVAGRIDRECCGVVIRLEEHAHSPEQARRIGHSIAWAIRDALIRRGAPPALEVEIDQPQASTVADGRPHRTLLPHHDGGNASYLTPSIHDDPDWDCELRRTSTPSVTTTRRHKLYQGFILQQVGDAESLTTYYDLLKLVRLAHARQTGCADAAVPAIAQWVGHNIRRAIAALEAHGGTYLTLGGVLGASRPSHIVVSVHQAEAELSEELVGQFPDLADLRDERDDGWGETERLFDRVLRDATGLGWNQIRQQVEVAVHGQGYDFILGHNLTLLHGGWRGGRGRVIEPICLVLERAAGCDYEAWLARAWRR